MRVGGLFYKSANAARDPNINYIYYHPHSSVACNAQYLTPEIRSRIEYSMPTGSASLALQFDEKIQSHWHVITRYYTIYLGVNFRNTLY